MFRILAHHLILLTFILLNISLIEVAGGSDLTGLNRDTSKSQEITKDMTTGTLDTSASIDNRVFTSEGRADIVKDHKKALSFIENVSENLYNAMAKDTKFSDALKSIKFEEVSKLAVENILAKENGAEILAIISGQESATVEEKDIALSIFASEIAGIYGVDVGDVKTMLTTEKIGGSFDKDNKDIYLNDLYVGNNIETGLGVLGHETGHAVYGDNEDTANYFGSRFTDAYTDGLWINGIDSKFGSWSSDDTNPLYIAQNNIDYAKVENKEDCGPLCLSVIGLTATISIANKYFKGEEVWDNMNDDQKSNYSSSTAFKLRNVATFGFTALNTESDMLYSAVPMAEEEVSKSSFVSNVGLNMTPILYKVGENQYYSFYDLEEAKDNNFYNKIWAGTEVALTGLSLGSSIVKGVNSLRYQTLYRAVEPEELLSIKDTGKFIPSPFGSEGKYFATTSKGALKEGKEILPKISGIEADNYKFVKASFPKKELKKITINVVDGDVETYVIPNEKLSLFKKIKEFK